MMTNKEIKKLRAKISATKKILLVEDDPVAQHINCNYLRCLGFTVDLAITGMQALHMIARSPYSLVFMDIGLPDVSGIDVTSIIRSVHKTLPIVVLTSLPDKNIKRKCLAIGANAVVSKPVPMVTLHSLVRQYIR
jgi:DNA-binding response OmpR family regulator